MIALALTASLLSIQTALIVTVGRAAKKQAFAGTPKQTACNPASEATIAGGNTLAGGSLEVRRARRTWNDDALECRGERPDCKKLEGMPETAECITQTLVQRTSNAAETIVSRSNALPASHSLSNTLAGSIADGRDRTRRDGTGRVNPAPGILGCEQQQSKDRHSDSTDSSRVIRPASHSIFERQPSSQGRMDGLRLTNPVWVRNGGSIPLRSFNFAPPLTTRFLKPGRWNAPRSSLLRWLMVSPSFQRR